MSAARMQRMAREYRERALLGTWCKTGKSQYTRMTGEVVEKRGSSWRGGGMFWQSAYAAMSHIDYQHRNDG